MNYSVKLCVRGFIVAGMLGFFLAGCTTIDSGGSALIGSKPLDERYTQPAGEAFHIPAVAPKIPPQYQRTVVSYFSSEAPGTIIVDPKTRYLYLIVGRGKAIRYGVGVGSAGLGFQGVTDLHSKQKWPRWIPTKDMIARNPARYKRYAAGVPGGLRNPLGARALYLYQNGKDTYYRIHGTTEPSSIGKSVSAGCIRMLNNDVIDLYERVKPGAKVIVR